MINNALSGVEPFRFNAVLYATRRSTRNTR